MPLWTNAAFAVEESCMGKIPLVQTAGSTKKISKFTEKGR